MKKLLSEWLMGEMIHKEEVDAPFDEVMQALEEAVARNGFGIQAVHDLKKTYEKHDLPLTPGFEYKIVQICQAGKSHKALTELGFDMGVMMPKSIIVARENGRTTLRYMKWKPWMVSLMFPEWDVVPLSKNVGQVMDRIVRDTIARFEKEKQKETSEV